MDYDEFVKSNGIEDVIDDWVKLLNEELDNWLKSFPAQEHQEALKCNILRKIAYNQQFIGSKPVTAEYVHNMILDFIDEKVRDIAGDDFMSDNEKCLLIKAYLDGYATREYIGW